MANQLFARLFKPSRSGRWVPLIALAMLILLIAVLSILRDTKVPEVESGRPDRLVLNKPLISPSAIRPASELTRVAFGTSIVDTSRFRVSVTPPQVLFLDEVTNRGNFIKKVAELRDDGKDPDARPGDGFYSGTLDLGSKEETEKYFRLRVELPGGTVTSAIAVFPITWLPLGFRPSNPDAMVDSADGQDKVFSNEAVVGTFTGVSTGRVQTIVAEVGNTLGLTPEAIRIAGYVPTLDAYLIEFEGDGTLQGVNRVISAFLGSAYHEDIKYASPNFQGRPAASQWFLDHIGIDKLRLGAGTSAVAAPVYGSTSIGVAVMENVGVDCSHPDLSGKCAPNPFPVGDSCRDKYTTTESPAGHGTKVASLIAGLGNNTTAFDGVDGGVAWNTRLFPYRFSGAGQLAEAITCVLNNNAAAGGPVTQIINISFASSPLTTLQTSVCDAVCNNVLAIAAAGNNACASPTGTGDAIDRYPAAYDVVDGFGNPAPNCPCGLHPGQRILRVGATDMAKMRGDKCAALGIKSKPGEIYAPGWGVPVDDNDASPLPTNYGTSWSTPLVAGCAAVRGAVQQWKGLPWDATAVETRLRNTSSSGAVPLLNCLAAVADPYDIVFVLDRSGSMGWTTNIDTTVAANRWDALGIGVTGLTPLISASAPPGSHFGLTLFAGTVLPDPFSGLATVDSNLPTNVSTALGVTPGGSTAMGSGLKAGMADLTDASRPRVILLFTDGEQNVPPMVNMTGCTFSDSSLVNPTCPGMAGSVKIIAVGIGNPSGLYHTTLQALANQNRGSLIITDNGTTFTDECTGDISAAFDCAIAPALYGNSPQMVASYKGTLSNTVTLAPFDLNKNVTQLLVKMSFSRKFEVPKLLSILAGVRILKDATDITRYFQPVFPSNFTNSVLLKTNFVHRKGVETSTITPEGSYTVQMTAPVNQSRDLGYRVVPYADDHRLGMEWLVNPAAPRVNYPFNPTVRLSWGGRPVTDASVEARILKPGNDLGDLLAKHPQTVDPVHTPDAGSPGYQKYLHLLESDPSFLAQLRPNEERLVLAHQGGGHYSTSYNPGDISGIYQIVYLVSAESAEFGKIQRKAVQSVYTRFGDIDLDGSAVSSMVKGNTVMINFRPITNYGRFIGPAQGSAFSVEGAGISLSSITDHQNGRYTLVLEGNPDAQVAIKLLGDKIYEGPASKIGKGIGPPWWLIWLIIVMILLLLIWLVWRVIGGTGGP
jgi:hypothetical protein